MNHPKETNHQQLHHPKHTSIHLLCLLCNVFCLMFYFAVMVKFACHGTTYGKYSGQIS